jgi:putative drug exporter of the RND superfamily
MYQFLGRIASAHPGKIVCAWIVVAIVLTLLAPDWKSQSQDDDIRFLPPDSPSVRSFQLLERAFPNDLSASKAIFTIERAGAPLSTCDFDLVDRMLARLEQLRQEQPSFPITGISSYKDGPVGRRLVSRDRQCTLIVVSLSTPYLAYQTRDMVDAAEAGLRPLVAAVGPDAPTLHVTGPSGIGRDLTDANVKSLHDITWATVALVVLVLLAIYRSPLLALVPLITIGLAVWVSLQLLALATLIPGVRLLNVSQVFCIVMLFGAGTDYCLFLISRYREELEAGQEPAAGVTRSVRSVGGALAASAATVVCGLGMMGFAEFGKIRCAGPVIALGLAVGLLAALTVTPALLRLGRRSVFWPQQFRAPTRPAHGRAWSRISELVVRRPHLVLFATLIPLAGLAALGLRIHTSFRPTGDLSPSADSVRGLDVIQKHFTAGETGPLTVLLTSRVDWNSPAGKELIAQLSLGFGYLPNVADVRSLTQPLGKAAPAAAEAPAPAGPRINLNSLLKLAKANFNSAMNDMTAIAAEPRYLAKIDEGPGALYVTRLDLILDSDPFDEQSANTLALVETWLRDLLPAQTAALGPVGAETSGVTVHGRDLSRAITRDRMRVNVLVSVGVLLILLAVVRRLWLAGYLLGTVLLSYLATLGITSLFNSWVAGEPFGVLDWRVPFFLFTILVAVGEDYNILLVSRILQERKRHGMIEGVRRGLAATGGTITACGLIMAGTFVTLLLAELSTLRQIGFALAVGVLLDTFVVRPLLVPALMVIVWRDAEAVQKQEVLVERQAA